MTAETDPTAAAAPPAAPLSPLAVTEENSDEIIRELWAAREAIAARFNYDPRALSKYYRTRPAPPVTAGPAASGPAGR